MSVVENWEKLKNSAGFEEFYFLAIALILAFGTIQTTGTALNTDRPVVTVISCSMYPVLNVGDIIVVRGVPYEQIEQGDIIVYSTPESQIPIIHRVILKNENYLETQGDNNRGQLEFEKHVTPEQIYGVAEFKIPRIGLVKLVTMDFVGISGDKPFILDSIPRCQNRT